MQNFTLSGHRAAPAFAAFPPLSAAKPQTGQGRTLAQTDELFVELLNAYRESGGLARLGEVVTLTRGACGEQVARLAAWIIERKVVSFEWQADLWLPLFQFNRSSMLPKPAAQQVVQALNLVLGPWELAAWFARPHVLLGNRSPADALDAGFPVVMQAANAEPVFASTQTR